MTSSDLLADSFERVRDAVHPAVNGLSPEELAFRPDPESNSIAWLVWHLTRIQDDHVSGLDGAEQIWRARGWAERTGKWRTNSCTGAERSRASSAAQYGHSKSV